MSRQIKQRTTDQLHVKTICSRFTAGILAAFVNDHGNSNNIIFPEQAAHKSGSWGCTDQLLINKAISEEVAKHRRNAAYV